MRSTADAKIKIESKSTARRQKQVPSLPPLPLFLSSVSLDEVVTGLVITYHWIEHVSSALMGAINP